MSRIKFKLTQHHFETDLSLRSVDDELNDRIMKRSASPYAMLERYMHALRKAKLLRTPQERDLGSAIFGTTDDINGGILNYQW